MRAAYYEKNGTAREVLSVGDIETPTPGPGPGEVRVRLRTSGVNPSDVKSREGRTRKIAFPRVIPHSDGAGDIDAVGDGVPKSRVGERVWTWNGQWKRPFGTCADYIVLPAALAVKLPDHVSYEAGACLGIPAMTAYHAVEVAGPAKTVLVSGGAGGVGHYAIQFAKARGATVITTVSSEAKAKLAREAGADHTIDYKRENVGERVMAITNKAGVDAVIEMDFSGNAKLMPSIVHPRSTIVVYGNANPEATIPSQFFLQNVITIKYIFVYELTQAERDAAISGINRMLENKTLNNNVALTLPLKDIVAAHEAVEQGKALGNVVVSMA